MSETEMVERVLTEIEATTTKLAKEFEGEDASVAIASLLVFCGTGIYRSIGGPQLAAAQLYHVADQEAGKVT